MGSGIALLPANLASIGGIAIWGWVISIIGAMSLAYVYARLATKNPQQGGPIAYAGEISPAFGFQTGVLYYHANWIGNLAIGITAVSYLSTFFPALNNPIPAGIACIAIVWLFTFINMLGGAWVSRLTTIGLFPGADPGSLDRSRRLALVRYRYLSRELEHVYDDRLSRHC